MGIRLRTSIMFSTVAPSRSASPQHAGTASLRPPEPPSRPRPWGYTNPATVPPPMQKSAIHTFETGFRGHPDKYLRDDRPRQPCRRLLANFRTVGIRPPERVEVPPGDWCAMVKARRSAHRAAHAYRDRLCQGLAEHGYHRVLDRMEPDPAGGSRVHIFLADDAALPLLDELAEGVCGLGDALSFDAEKFVLQRIRYLIENETHS